MELGGVNAMYNSRDEVKIRKIGMLMSLAEGNYENLTADVLQRAERILDYATESVRILLGTGHGGTVISESAQKMLSCIYNSGGCIAYSSLLKCMYHKRFLSKDVLLILQMLEEAKVVRIFERGRQRYIRTMVSGEESTVRE